MNYRTEIRICVGCSLEVRYKLRVSAPKWAGLFRQAISSRECPKCTTIAALAKEGDEICSKLFNERQAAYS